MASSSVADAQDVTAGATAFKKCASCHDVGAIAKNKVGPVLNGLDGRKSGSAAGYNYSDANKNSGITWDEANFLDYIRDPKAKVPNTKMAFAGLKNEAEAKNLWAYLKQYDADGKTKSATSNRQDQRASSLSRPCRHAGRRPNTYGARPDR